MFTGIIYQSGLVVKNEALQDSSRLLEVQFVKNQQNQNHFNFSSINIGDSVAINGICLTVVKINSQKSSLEFFVSRETVAKTTIMLLNNGARINAELAMLASSRFGGHLVSGHVDEVAKLVSKKTLGDSYVLGFECSIKNAKYLIKKGSICIDGVSLTINNVFKNPLEVCIIPHTWQNTTLSLLDTSVNNMCNIEFDYFAKIIVSNISNLVPSR